MFCTTNISLANVCIVIHRRHRNIVTLFSFILIWSSSFIFIGVIAITPLLSILFAMARTMAGANGLKCRDQNLSFSTFLYIDIYNYYICIYIKKKISFQSVYSLNSCQIHRKPNLKNCIKRPMILIIWNSHCC